jgi:hypothetical protein
LIALLQFFENKQAKGGIALRPKFVALILLLSIVLFPSCGLAKVYYSGPQTFYVRPDPYYQTGQAIGNLLSALFQSSQQKVQAEQEAKRQQEIANFIANIRNQMRLTAKKEADFVANCVGQYGITNSIKGIMTMLVEQGFYAEAASKDGIEYLYWENEVPGASKIGYLYALDRGYQQCRVSVSIPYLNLEERQSSMFTEPRPQSIAQAVSDYLGLSTSTQIVGKNGHFGFTVLDVARGSIAHSAGIQPGDMISQIDSYPLKDRSIEQVVSYIANRVSQGARVNIKLVRKGKVSYANVQF